jgi:hypothetical protein
MTQNSDHLGDAGRRRENLTTDGWMMAAQGKKRLKSRDEFCAGENGDE